MMSAAEKLESAARQIRRSIIDTAFNAPADGVHLGSALSMVDIAVVLYGAVMRYQPENMASLDRDRFLLSKGHAALALYTVLHHYGVLSSAQLATFDCNGSLFPALTPMNPALGIDFAGGSLGHGVGYACGIAWHQRLKKLPWKSYVVLGDGECNEGTIWESALFAAHHGLDNITAIIDVNGYQSDIACEKTLKIDLVSLWQACGWHVEVCDGHDFGALQRAFSVSSYGKPKAVIASTLKGKGISFMENNNAYHRAKLSTAQHLAALEELK